MLKEIEKHNLPITFSILKNLFLFVDSNKDNKLDEDEFYRLLLEEKCNNYYIKKIKRFNNLQQYDFIPRSLSDLLLHVEFRINHADCINSMLNNKENTDKRVNSIDNMLGLVKNMFDHRILTKT